jgi:TetR/AcrR family transcriptional regulator, transcriptional repressor for nem operon
MTAQKSNAPVTTRKTAGSEGEAKHPRGASEDLVFIFQTVQSRIHRSQAADTLSKDEMARSKEFDEEHALAAAVDVFWRQGYENTSLEALMREMGIARQSLYDTFGDKRALYLKAMAFYRERTNSSLRESLASAPTVKEGFTRVLLGLVAESREQHARGCLLLSANMERAVDDEEIARFLEDNQAEVESIFADALRRGQRGDELRPGTDAGALAKFFVATIQGMRAMARLKSDRRALRQVARIALAVFDR